MFGISELSLRLYHVYLANKYIHKPSLYYPHPSKLLFPVSLISFEWQFHSWNWHLSLLLFLFRRSSVWYKPLWIYENHVSQRLSSIVFTGKGFKEITCPRSTTTLALPFVIDPPIQDTNMILCCLVSIQLFKPFNHLINYWSTIIN